MGVTEDVPAGARVHTPEDALVGVRSAMRRCEDAAIKLDKILGALHPVSRARTLNALTVSRESLPPARDAADAVLAALKADAAGEFCDRVIASAKADYLAAARLLREAITALDQALATAIDKANAPSDRKAKAKAEPQQ